MNSQPIVTAWCVLTGAPSSGKTTTLEFIRRLGFPIVREEARAYIEEQLSLGFTLAEIRRDEAAFQQEIVKRKQAVEDALSAHTLTFLDRAMPDSISYLRAAGIDAGVMEAVCAKRRYAAVFILDPLPLESDGVRVEDDAAAQRLDQFLEQDYRRLGYSPVRVPLMSPAMRASFIVERCTAGVKIA